MLFAPQKALEYGQAANLSDPVFWAYAAYDGKKYTEALDFLALLENNPPPEALLLASDIHTILGDIESGRQVREALIDKGTETLPAQLYLNGAKDARENNDLAQEAVALYRLLE